MVRASLVLLLLSSVSTVVAEPIKPQPRIENPQRRTFTENFTPEQLALIGPAANTRTIFMHRCSASQPCNVGFGNTDSRTNKSNIGQGNLSAFSQGDTVWNQTVSCMRDVFTPFAVDIVTVDPGNANHFEIMVGGSPQQLGLNPNTGGISPYNCGAAYIPNSLVFVFDVWGPDVEDICSTAAQEVAHSFRLDHVTEASDPLTYNSYQGRRHFKDTNLQCGSDCVNGYGPFGQAFPCNGQNHACYTKCSGPYSQTENPVQTIKALFGNGTPTPPTLNITKPKTGDNVVPGFPITADVTDDNGIEKVELRIDNMLVDTRLTTPIYAFNAPTTLGDGTHQVELTAYDSLGATTKKMVSVIIGKPCTKPADCPMNTDTCIGGRCVPGPGAQGGLGSSCVDGTGCASGICASDAEGTKYCVEECALDAGQCPDGFGCLDAGNGKGVCWPGFDDGTQEDEGGCSTGAGGPVGFSVTLALLMLVRRRKGR